MAAIAAGEPSEAGSATSELANIGGPKGWSGEHTQCAAPEHWAAYGGAHEGRALCAKQAEVSPMKQGVPQASL